MITPKWYMFGENHCNSRYAFYFVPLFYFVPPMPIRALACALGFAPIYAAY